MKHLIVLLLVGAACWAQAKKLTCESKATTKLVPFYEKPFYVKIPCKFWALKRQQCGKYSISLAPGNVWLGEKYYLNSLWLGITDMETKEQWDLRTTNKLAVKFYRSNGARNLFNELNNKTYSTRFSSKNERGASGTLYENDNQFQVTFTPWDPYSKGRFPAAIFKFECLNDTMPPNPIPKQMCGDPDGTMKLEDRAQQKRDNATNPNQDEPFNLNSNHDVLVFYYDVLMSNVVQTDDKCIEAANIMQHTCGDFETRVNTLKNCMEILLKPRLSKCITYHTCHLMDSFNACMRWGCTGNGFDEDETNLCSAVAETIELCPTITGAGNLTARVKDLNCYKEYSFGPSTDTA